MADKEVRVKIIGDTSDLTKKLSNLKKDLKDIANGVGNGHNNTFDKLSNDAEDFKDKDLNEIVLCGFVTDICVVNNALILRAKFPNTKITVMKDLCARATKENHEAALQTMRSCQINVI